MNNLDLTGALVQENSEIPTISNNDERDEINSIISYNEVQVQLKLGECQQQLNEWQMRYESLKESAVHTVTELQAKCAKNDKDIEGVDLLCIMLKKENEVLSSKLEQTEQSLLDIVSSSKEDMESEILTFETLLDETTKTFKDMKNQVETSKTQLQIVNDTNEDLRTKLFAMSDSQTKFPILIADLQAANEVIEDLEVKLMSMADSQSKFPVLMADLQIANETNEDLRIKLFMSDSKLEKTQSDMEILEHQLSASNSELARSKQEIKDLQTIISGSESWLEQTNKTIEDFQVKLKDIQDMQSKLSDLQYQLMQANKTIEDLKNVIPTNSHAQPPLEISILNETPLLLSSSQDTNTTDVPTISEELAIVNIDNIEATDKVSKTQTSRSTKQNVKNKSNRIDATYSSTVIDDDHSADDGVRFSFTGRPLRKVALAVQAVQETQTNNEKDNNNDDIKCKICTTGHDDRNLLLCDICETGYHTYCLVPPLRKIPEGDWLCKECRKVSVHDQALMSNDSSSSSHIENNTMVIPKKRKIELNGHGNISGSSTSTSNNNNNSKKAFKSIDQSSKSSSIAAGHSTVKVLPKLYNVEKVLHHKGSDRHKNTYPLRFRIRWEGTLESEDTYEPWENVKDCQIAINYVRNHPQLVYLVEKKANSIQHARNNSTTSNNNSSNNNDRTNTNSSSVNVIGNTSGRKTNNINSFSKDK